MIQFLAFHQQFAVTQSTGIGNTRAPVKCLGESVVLKTLPSMYPTRNLKTFAFWCTQNDAFSRILLSTISCYSKCRHREHEGDCEMSWQEPRAQDIAKHVSDEKSQNICVLIHAWGDKVSCILWSMIWNVTQITALGSDCVGWRYWLCHKRPQQRQHFCVCLSRLKGSKDRRRNQFAQC